MRSQPAKRIAMSFKLEKSRVAALKRLSAGLPFQPTMTVLMEQGIDLLVARYSKEAAASQRKKNHG